MSVEASAPTRIDLAGGTLDIWPLSMLEAPVVTVNAAINIRTEVRVEKLEGGRVFIESIDRAETVEAGSLPEALSSRRLSLITRIIGFYVPGGGLRITTHCHQPPGSGLGGSSSLAISLSAALCRISGREQGGEERIRTVWNLEAQELQVPTGLQDYYAAEHGGLAAYWWRPDATRIERMPPPPWLEDGLVLCFTGEPHFSGAPNWEVTRKRIDGDDEITARLGGIKRAAYAVRDALAAGDRDAFAKAMDEEWRMRKLLTPGITTDFIERLVAVSRKKGALAAKVCGAGGGGCVAFFCEPGRKDAIEQALAREGASVLPVRIDQEGVHVR